MDVTTIALGAGAGLLLAAVVVTWLVSRTRRGRLSRALAASQQESAILVAAAAERAREAAAIARRLDTARDGEREAAWAARASAGRLAALGGQVAALEEGLRRAHTRAAELEAEVATLQRHGEELRADTARARLDAATRVTELEAALRAARDDSQRLRDEIDAARREAGAVPAPPPDREVDDLRTRLHASIAESGRLRDRVDALETTLATRPVERPLLPPDPWIPDAIHPDQVRLTAELEAARLAGEAARREAERLALEIGRVREEADRRVAAAVAGLAQPPPLPAPPAGPSPLLLAREAEVRDLEERLAALTATRNAELKRLNERIASLERLYRDLDVRDARIAELETELKQATEVLDAARVETMRLEGRLAEAGEEVAAANRSLAAAQSLGAELDGARRRLADLETASLRARANDDEVAGLRTLLAAERDRNARLERRSATDGEVARAVAAATAPLQATIARLEGELDSLRPPQPPPVPDDVTLIRGIGPRIAAILAANGVTSLRQIASFTAGDVARIGPLLPVYPQRIVDDAWVAQARTLLGLPG